MYGNNRTYDYRISSLPSPTFNRRSGSVLIIAMIIGAGMLVVAIEVSMFVTSTILQARSIDRTLSAFYAAESGAESALHQVRKEGRSELRPDSAQSSSLYTVDARDAAWTFKDGAIIDTKKFSSSVQKIMKPFLGEQESLDIHLWTENVGTGFSGLPSDMKKMRVAWKKSECAEGDTPWIELSAAILSFSGATLTGEDKYSMTKDFQKPAEGATEVFFQLSRLAPEGESLAGKGLTLRVKPFFCSLRDIDISFPKEDDQTQLISIPNYFLIHPAGIFGNIQKDIHIIMPKYAGATGIFDYALFGEEKLEKNEK